MEQTPGSGHYPPMPRDSADLLYDRNVRTQVRRHDSEHLVVTASMSDDTLGPGGFVRIHEMSLEVDLTAPGLEITDVRTRMTSHPHGTCPLMIRDMRELVGMRIGRGYFAELRAKFGGNRGCNHLHMLAQSIGTVASLTFAARLFADGELRADVPPEQWFGGVAKKYPQVIDSCKIWHHDGDLVRRLQDVDAEATAGSSATESITAASPVTGPSA